MNRKLSSLKPENKHGYKISSRCESSSCVGVKQLPTGTILVTNTSNKKVKPIAFTKEEWLAFTQGVKNNEFDFNKF